jgi:hypothetical protein
MVSFRDNRWLGEALHLAREHGVLISLICHASVALTSTLQRIDGEGTPHRVAENPFLDATITTHLLPVEEQTSRAQLVASRTRTPAPTLVRRPERVVGVTVARTPRSCPEAAAVSRELPRRGASAG